MSTSESEDFESRRPTGKCLYRQRAGKDRYQSAKQCKYYSDSEYPERNKRDKSVSLARAPPQEEPAQSKNKKDKAKKSKDKKDKKKKKKKSGGGCCGGKRATSSTETCASDSCTEMRAVDSSSDRYAALESRIAKLELHIDDMNAIKASQGNNESDARIENLQKQFECLADEIDTYAQDLEGLQSNMKCLEEQVDCLTEAMNSLPDNAPLQDKVEALQKQMKLVMSEIADLKKNADLAVKQKSSTDLSSRKKVASKETIGNKDKIKNMQAQIKQLIKERDALKKCMCMVNKAAASQRKTGGGSAEDTSNADPKARLKSQTMEDHKEHVQYRSKSGKTDDDYLKTAGLFRSYNSTKPLKIKKVIEHSEDSAEEHFQGHAVCRKSCIERHKEAKSAALAAQAHVSRKEPCKYATLRRKRSTSSSESATEEAATCLLRKNNCSATHHLPQVTSFCRHCNKTTPIVMRGLYDEVIKLIVGYKPKQVALTILLQADKLYHVIISEAETGDPVGNLHATDEAMREAQRDHLFEDFLTYFIIDARTSLSSCDGTMFEKFDFINLKRIEDSHTKGN